MIPCEKNADCSEHIDRISELPNNVIEVILEHLAIEDLVKTSILSRKWRYTWASVLRLEFENNFFEKCKHLETSSIISEVLLLHHGPVHDFILHIPSNYPIKKECLGKWILFLSRNDIKEIQLVNLRTDPYQTPSHIFSCGNLNYLYLDNFKLPTMPNFCGFKSLAFLYLFDMIFEPGAFERLVSDCPLLVVLTISHCSGFEHINVSSPILEYLWIEGDEVMKSICLKQAHNLIDLTLWSDRREDNFEGGWVYDLMKNLPKIKRLDLGGGYIKIFSENISPQMLLWSDNVLKYLELCEVDFNEAGELLFIISLLESCPNLEKLDIKSGSKAVQPHMNLKEFECNDCCFSQLQIVNITVGTAYKHALNLIKLVLAKSLSLEILTFKVGLGLNQSDERILSRISRDLLQMKRASTRAEVKLLHNGLIE